MTLDPALLPWADKAIILVLIVLMFLLARGQRALSFSPPVIPVGPLPIPGPTVPAPVQPPPGSGPAPEPPKPVPAPPIIVPPVVVPPTPAGGDFERCLAVTLKWEGGNDDDRRDPGGRTSRGITAGDWAEWRQTHPGLPADVWQAPQDQIVAIFKERYWIPLYCDSLPNGVDMEVFDHGVLAGIGTSAKLLQALVGTNVDGEIGPLTIAAAAAMDPVSLVGRFSDGRLAYYQSRPGWPIYGKGWTNRVVDVRKEALALAAEAPRPKPAGATPSASAPSPAGPQPVPSGDNHLKVLTDQQCRDLFGSFSYSNGSNGDIIQDPAWVAAHIVDAPIPQLAKFKIKSVKCHKLVAPWLIKAFAEIEAAGLLGTILSYDGLWVPRHINHNPSQGISRHSYGAAMDINANWNAYGTLGAKRGTAGSTWEIEPIMAANGFACGRWFGWPHLPASDTDAMHFEWVGPPG